MVKIYCDGSCLGNPGPGGWASVFIYKGQTIKKIYGFDNYTTNNKMELIAAIKSLENANKYNITQIYTDSSYVKLGITDWINSWKRTNWKNGKIKNIILWKKLDELNSIMNIEWHWVKGHNGDKYNKLADKLARHASVQKIQFS